MSSRSNVNRSITNVHSTLCIDSATSSTAASSSQSHSSFPYSSSSVLFARSSASNPLQRSVNNAHEVGSSISAAPPFTQDDDTNSCLQQTSPHSVILKNTLLLAAAEHEDEYFTSQSPLGPLLSRTYSFDHVHTHSSLTPLSTHELFARSRIRRDCQRVMDGKRLCVIAYGSRSSRKHIDMCGRSSSSNHLSLIGLTCKELLPLIQVRCTSTRLYQLTASVIVHTLKDQLHDVLATQPAFSLTAGTPPALLTPSNVHTRAQCMCIDSHDNIRELLRVFRRASFASSASVSSSPSRQPRGHVILTLSIKYLDIDPSTAATASITLRRALESRHSGGARSSSRSSHFLRSLHEVSTLQFVELFPCEYALSPEVLRGYERARNVEKKMQGDSAPAAASSLASHSETERANLAKSLDTLEHVLYQLTTSSPATSSLPNHISHRSSKLTWLLQPTLQSSPLHSVHFLTFVNPAEQCAEEIQHMLRLGAKIKEWCGGVSHEPSEAEEREIEEYLTSRKQTMNEEQSAPNSPLLLEDLDYEPQVVVQQSIAASQLDAYLDAYDAEQQVKKKQEGEQLKEMENLCTIKQQDDDLSELEATQVRNGVPRSQVLHQGSAPWLEEKINELKGEMEKMTTELKNLKTKEQQRAPSLFTLLAGASTLPPSNDEITVDGVSNQLRCTAEWHDPLTGSWTRFCVGSPTAPSHPVSSKKRETEEEKTHEAPSAPRSPTLLPAFRTTTATATPRFQSRMTSSRNSAAKSIPLSLLLGQNLQELGMRAR